MHDSFLAKLFAGDQHLIIADKGSTVEDLLSSDVGLNTRSKTNDFTRASSDPRDYFSVYYIVEIKLKQIKNLSHFEWKSSFIMLARLDEQMISAQHRLICLYLLCHKTIYK